VLARIERGPGIRAHCKPIGDDDAAHLCSRSAVTHPFGIRSPHEDSKRRFVRMVAERQVLGGSRLWVPAIPRAQVRRGRREVIDVVRICSGVWPVRLRTTFAKWEASENPARRPISAVVTRSNSGD
jgi:hypothetical protein